MSSQLEINTSYLQILLEKANSLPIVLDTSDATAETEDIVINETAYVNGVKITGTNPYEKTTTDTEINSQAAKIAEISALLDGKSVPGNGAVETCTVNVGYAKTVYYTGIENGEIVSKSSVGTSTTSLHSFTACRNSIIFCCGVNVGDIAASSYGYEDLGFDPHSYGASATLLTNGENDKFYAILLTGNDVMVNFIRSSGGGSN